MMKKDGEKLYGFLYSNKNIIWFSDTWVHMVKRKRKNYKMMYIFSFFFFPKEQSFLENERPN